LAAAWYICDGFSSPVTIGLAIVAMVLAPPS
jgi:hypothetical protein